MTQRTLAEELKAENEALRRRFLHHTRPKGPLTLEQASKLSERMQSGWPDAVDEQEQKR